MARSFLSICRNAVFLGVSSAALAGCATAIQAENRASVAEASPDAAHAKNLILFIGDGMGVSTVTAGRIFDGQSKGMTGEEHSLAFEDFDHLALIKTYNVNSQVPDSAGTATAIMSGYKANIGTINVQPDTRYQGCGENAATMTLSERGMAAGKSVGIVSTTRITHATPAAMYGHVDDRDWESDQDISDDAKQSGCQSLAAQLVDSKVELALGGGRKEFSADQINALKKSHYYAANRSQLMAAPPGRTVRGLFSNSHMSFEADRDPAQEPSLAEMTAFAIERLSADQDGYVLMIEAGRIDHAHHGTNAYRALTDVQALNEAVKIAKAASGDDTLILVTADHSHVFTMAGYPVRGNPILGLVREADREAGGAEKDYSRDENGKPYTTLGYHNGENPRALGDADLTDAEVQSKDYHQESAVELDTETHGGEDVPLYARGPGAAGVKGVMEQDEIGRLIAAALGLE